MSKMVTEIKNLVFDEILGVIRQLRVRKTVPELAGYTKMKSASVYLSTFAVYVLKTRCCMRQPNCV